jgi:hypothetical protein
MDQIEVESAKGDLVLIIEPEESPDNQPANNYKVSIVGSGLNATITVYDGMWWVLGVTLWGFFEFMNLHKEGWSGEHIRRSMEEDFILVATIDNLGNIDVRIIFDKSALPTPWKLEATLYLYASQLPEIVNQIRRCCKGDW